MGLRIKNFKKWHLKRGGGAWTVWRFKGRGAWQERGRGKGGVGCFWEGGFGTPMLSMGKKEKKKPKKPKN